MGWQRLVPLAPLIRVVGGFALSVLVIPLFPVIAKNEVIQNLCHFDVLPALNFEF